MDLDKTFSWEVIKNTVRDRMVESSLIHRFSKSKKYRRSTKLLNNWLENHRKFSYADYIWMKRLTKECVSEDVIVEDNDSYGEEDYLIAHKKHLCKSKIKNNQNEIFNDKDVLTSTPKKVIKKEKEISFTDSDSLQTGLKYASSESNIFQDTDSKINIKSFSDIQNVDTIPAVEIKQLVNSPEQYLTPTKKTQLIDNKKKRFVNTTDNSFPSAKKRKKSKEASLSNRDNDSFMNDKRTGKEILDLIPDKQEITTCCSNTTHNNINSFSIQTQRSPVMVSSTEIIDNEYKIINKKKSCSNLWNEYDDSFKLLKNNYSLEFSEYKEEEEEEEELKENGVFIESTNSSILSTSEKRFNQIKHLNLTIENSSSEDEVQERKENLNKKMLLNNSSCIATKKTTTCNKNLNLTIESSSKNEILEREESLPNNSNCMANKKITKCSKNFNLNKESTSSEDELLKGKDFNEKINNSNSTTSKETTKLKLKRSSNVDHKNDQSIPNMQSKDNSINHNNSIDHRNNDSKNCEQLQTFHGIPCNLQDLINKEKLVHDTTKSAFTIEDISQDNEIFLLNIPSTVQLTGLEGQKIRLKGTKLKLGMNRYKISYKDVPSQSCIFATHKNNKPYKLVNIKPTSSILVRQKLSPSSSPSWSS